ncbi:MAG: Gfo/Idh/MocA family oxidoreductase [Trueperaceae bacterium]|nr:MAG: Gfo/Idh/MocA family oxidoreductase [Trueperaceae bacterium]
MNRPVRWGILSTAKIAETAFIPALRQSTRGEVVAVASRSRERAEAFAGRHRLPMAFGSYAELLACGDVDAIYNPMPNTLHAEWTVAAARSGKHVFCEKPLAMSPAEAELMIEACAAAGVVLVEAFVFLFHPQTLKLRQLLDRGAIGRLLHVHAYMTFSVRRPSENIRLNRSLGGGSLLDTGGYPITFSRFAFGEEPVSVQAETHIDPLYGVDTRAGLILRFPGDGIATLSTGLDAVGGPGAALFGDEGWIELPTPYHPTPKSEFTLHTRTATETFEFDTGVVPFSPAIEHFHTCVAEGERPLVGPENALGTLRVIEAALEAGRTGQRIEV